MDYTVAAITRFVAWLCRKLTRDQLITAIAILLEVVEDKRDDLRPRNDFEEKHPHYRKFTVDPLPALAAPPAVEIPEPTAQWRVLCRQYRLETGKELKPVRRRGEFSVPPGGSRCQRCQAPERYLYVNDGKVGNQLRCKVCGMLFSSQRCRRQNITGYWCPYCKWGLFLWRESSSVSIYKCRNRQCPCYTGNLARLNDSEKALFQTERRSTFKLAYQYRDYHVNLPDLRTIAPEADTIDLNRIRKNMTTLGLVLAYSVSFGQSNRMTARILRDIHGIPISHQCVGDYVEAAGVLAARFTEKHLGKLTDRQVAGDETYIKVGGSWHFSWFVIGAQSRAVRAWHVSEARTALDATATLNSMLEHLPDRPALPIEFVADANPAYDLAVHIINAHTDGTTKPLQRHTVVGLTNEDDESEQFRPFKQLIERLNRTYKFHTRARSGFKTQKGAVALTALFVAHYNFLRPHGGIRYRVPVYVPELHTPHNLQGQWLKLLQMAA